MQCYVYNGHVNEDDRLFEDVEYSVCEAKCINNGQVIEIMANIVKGGLDNIDGDWDEFKKTESKLELNFPHCYLGEIYLPTIIEGIWTYASRDD